MQRSTPKLRWRRALTYAFGLIFGVGCAADELPHFGTLQYESENFEVWASDGLVACSGTYEYTEHWLSSFRERVGEYSGQQPHTFYWLDADDFSDNLCPSTFGGCAHASANIIYSTLIPTTHEIVHTELNRAFAPSLLREGAAEVFGFSQSTDRVSDLGDLFGRERIPGSAYRTAGRFSRMLIDQYGLDAYFELHDALHKTTGRDAFAVGVSDTLDVELSTLEQDFEMYASCSVDRWRFYDYECSELPIIPWDNDGRWVQEVSLSCADQDVIGPRGDVIWTLRAFEVAELTSFRTTIASTDETANVTVFECNADCRESYVPQGSRSAWVNHNDGAGVIAAYDKGRYWMRIEHAANSDASVTVTLE